MADTMNILDEEFDKNPKQKVVKTIKEEKVNVTNIEKTVEKQTLILDQRQKGLVNVYKNENKVPVRVAPSYAKYFGRVMRVSINGISIAIACNGTTVELPETYAAEILRRMNEVDMHELRLNKMSQVQANHEMSPGQINFFG